MLPASLHPIERSSLYRLGRKKDLSRLLGVSLTDLKKLASDENYKEWSKKQTGKKDRVIEQPLPPLEVVLGRLHMLLSRIETPPWLLSGKKGVKPSDNARYHLKNGHMINVDIEGFYQNARREFVYRAFIHEFGQAHDVASLLANLVTYKNHIPTGTATSQIIAFWAYKKTFERIYGLCKSHDILMTVWVDDITFSSQKPFPKDWVKNIQSMMKQVGLSLKTAKTKSYSPKCYKIATGSAISPEGDIRVKNEKRHEILEVIKDKRVELLPLKNARQVLGKLVAQRQNEPEFFSNLYARTKKRVQILLKRKKKRIQSQNRLPQ